MIKINNISLSFGEKRVFDNFSLTIGDNDRIWLYGKSGSGKTTLTRLIFGFLKPQSGSIEIDENLKPSAVFQENRLLLFKSALDNVLLVTKDKKKAVDVLSKLGLKDEINSPVKNFSGGMQRKVALARALCADFDYLVLDEPFTGMDDQSIKTAAELILCIAQNKPIILITHNSFEAELLGAQKKEL